MESYWKKNVKMPRFEDLRGDLKTDVLIIGGGMAGILCAYFLREAGVDCVIVEADRIGMGITGNTTAKISSQHGLIYADLYRRLGKERASLYLRANEEAIGDYRRLCQGMDCEFEEQNSFVYSLNDAEAIEKEAEALEKIGYSAMIRDRLALPFSIAGAVGFSHQAQFHPLKFLSQIAAPLTIYENTRVKELIGRVAVTDGGARIRAERIVVATHFPFLNKHGSYFLKMYQSRSYVCAFCGADKVDGMYLDASGEGLSFRNAGDLLLIGGGSHRTGKKSAAWRSAEEFAKKHYPDAKCEYRWATQDCMTLDRMPYIGQYSARTQGLYVATGFGKWGMTSSMVSARLLTSLLLGNGSVYESLFSPSRSILHPQLAVNAWEAASHLVSFSTKRCPHMGCALQWNPQERSWDCPCHGSRFDERGRLLDNPATGDLPCRDGKQKTL